MLQRNCICRKTFWIWRELQKERVFLWVELVWEHFWNFEMFAPGKYRKNKNTNKINKKSLSLEISKMVGSGQNMSINFKWSWWHMYCNIHTWNVEPCPFSASERTLSFRKGCVSMVHYRWRGPISSRRKNIMQTTSDFF